jgi:hypothetical protein
MAYVSPTPASFVAPEGRLTEAMFPDITDGDLEATWLPAWIAQGEANVGVTGGDDDDDGRLARAVEAWVYYRAWNHRCQRLLDEPMRVDIEGSHSTQRSVAQVDSVCEQAAAWRATYEREAGVRRTPTRLRGTGSVPTKRLI